MKPARKPSLGHFSSGPCAKRPGWTLAGLGGACLGRSHRSSAGKARLAEALDRTRAVLGIPDTHRLAIVPASDTGAVEMALWSLLGPRGVDVLVWESFSKGWAGDVTGQLKLADVRVLDAPYGALPDLAAVDWTRDVVFVWNGTTSGVRVPDGGWIDADRQGLAICDATSAAFAMDLPWERLDVVTWSWQKCLGGEGGHGMLALGPRAVERLLAHAPAWPMPKIFRMTKGGRLDEDLFAGATINTPSLLCVEDWIDALRWAEGAGGLPALVARAEGNLAAIAAWVERSSSFGFLAADPAVRSCTSVCLTITAPWFAALPTDEQRARVGRLVKLLAAEGVAHDIGAYRDAPPGLRVWAGPTIETADLEALLPWLDWALAQVAD
ncbi:MAG TPA: phosphoserine transaminase [Candidatus Krumholzibacteria bacterium]|nr:phosphoserine transaminase [Candidatus Krumholzibacteria bacterium]